MKKVILLGHLPSQTRLGLFETLFHYGFELTAKEKNAIHTIVLADKIYQKKGHSSSILGHADIEKNIAYVVYPSASEIRSECFGSKQLKTNSDRLFSLTCVHELLHLAGVNHCNTKGCIMAKLSCSSSQAGYCLSCLSAQKEMPALCDDCLRQLGKST